MMHTTMSAAAESGAAPGLAPLPLAGRLHITTADAVLAEAYTQLASAAGFAVVHTTRLPQLYDAAAAGAFDAALVDLPLGEAALLDTLRELRRQRPRADVVLMSSSASVQTAVEAMKVGAFDFVVKPYGMEDLALLFDRLASHLRMAGQARLLRDAGRSRAGWGGLIGNSTEMEKLYRMISKAAYSQHPVLILGESGTGKELVARSIHYSGPHRDKPFIPVDCGSLVPTLIESELFGYVKGAFTGASRSKQGLLSIANGGTVFLDEVGELPVELQAKLLRALQEKEIRPVGGTQSIKIDVRILAATNRDLEIAVDSGHFRKDLFYRLNVLALRIPPLRERRGDVPLLVEHFLERLGRGGARVRDITPEALEMLLQYDWPGNVRELENCLERASALSSGPALHAGDLASQVRNARAAQVAAAVESGRITPLAELEKRAILAALEELHGDKLLAARMLGIGKTTLYRKLKEYG
jgi:two-component system response regulator HydG